jgi:hypothetical protein
VPWRPLLATAACTVAVVLVVLVVSALQRDRPPPTLPRLEVNRLEVTHQVHLRGDEFLRRGVLGRDSFQTCLGDGVTVEARLSRPAYAYLIAFRPDGTDDVCFPDQEGEEPLPTDQPRYRPADGKVYELAEGEGLQVFAVVASSRPLPSYKEWRSQVGEPRWARGLSSPDDVVWWIHDNEAEPLTDDPAGQRGKGREVAGKTPVSQLTDWLRRAPGIEAAAAVGFKVLPAPKR